MKTDVKSKCRCFIFFSTLNNDSSDDAHVVVKIIADDDDETVECMGQSHNRRCQKSPSITARYRAKTF